MNPRLIGYWIVLCIASAIGAAYVARALDQQFALRQKLGLQPPPSTAPLSTTPAKP